MESSFSRISLVKKFDWKMYVLFNQCFREREENVKLLLSFNSQCTKYMQW